jgi:Fur family transcriptional regulator, ferric uptake regulator
MNEHQIRRNTRQRGVILEELQKLTSHPTAAGLYEIVRRRLPKISLGTVYRNLDLLARLGTIQKLEFGAGEARFDGNVQRHDHVRCVRCGRLDDIHGIPLDLSGGIANDFSNYRILGCRREYWGVCPECQGRQDHSEDSCWSNSPTVAPTRKQDQEIPYNQRQERESC